MTGTLCDRCNTWWPDDREHPGYPAPHPCLPPDDLAIPPTPGTHRFADWHSGTHYAFARGLNVSPAHLPAALDAMEDAGWTLAAVFGETTAEKIGFLFRRKKQKTKRHTISVEEWNKLFAGDK